MKRFAIFGALAAFTTVAVMSCRNDARDDTELAISALYAITSNVRAFRRADGVPSILFRQNGQTSISALNGNPGARTLHNIGGLDGGPPWGYRRSDDLNIVLYISSDRHIHEISQVGSGVWTDWDLAVSLGINAPPAASASGSVFGYVRQSGLNVLYYRDDNNHVIEIHSNFGGPGAPWLPADLTALVAGAQEMASNDPFPYRRVDLKEAVVYTAWNGRVHELLLTSGGWVDNDLFAASGETIGPSTELWANANPFEGTSAVVYTGTDGLLHRLYTGTGCAQPWCRETIPTIGSPSPFLRPASYVRSDGVPTVLYVEQGPDIHNLREASKAQGTWTNSLLLAGGSSSFGEPFGYVAQGQRNSVVINNGNHPTATFGFEVWKTCGSGGSAGTRGSIDGGGNGTGAGGSGGPLPSCPGSWVNEAL